MPFRESSVPEDDFAVIVLALQSETEKLSAQMRAAAMRLDSDELRERTLLEIENSIPEDDRRIAELVAASVSRRNN